MVGGLDGGSGDSMQVTINGSAAGRFIDHANPTDKGGTPLYLWSKVKSIPFGHAVKEAREWLGIKGDSFTVRAKSSKVYGMPPPKALEAVDPVPGSKAYEYLTKTRKLQAQVLEDMGITCSEDGETIVFPYQDYNEESKAWETCHVKRLKVERPSGKKEIYSTAATKRVLFGKQLIDDTVSAICIQEGELDAATMKQWGIPAVSVPNGVSDVEWIDLDWNWLERFEKIYLFFDNDDPGKQFSIKVAQRIGVHRCFIVSLKGDYKDPNSCLVDGNWTAEDMQKVLAEAKAIDLAEIKRPDEYTKEVVDYFTNDPSLRGWPTPWTPSLEWRLRPGELTILTGYSSHGKTALLNQLMVHLLSEQCKILDISLEVPAAETSYYMACCALGKLKAPKEEAEGVLKWMGNNLMFLDIVGTATPDKLFEAMDYSRKRHGVDIIVLDSLFKCGVDSKDYEAQRQFIDRLTTFVNKTRAHVILVAHSRKSNSGNELSPPNKSDISGSSDLQNGAHNILVCWRNVLKERNLKNAKKFNNIEDIEKWGSQPDGQIVIEKQRFGGGRLGEIDVFFDRDSLQFQLSEFGAKPYYIH